MTGKNRQVYGRKPVIERLTAGNGIMGRFFRDS